MPTNQRPQKNQLMNHLNPSLRIIISHKPRLKQVMLLRRVILMHPKKEVKRNHQHLFKRKRRILKKLRNLKTELMKKQRSQRILIKNKSLKLKKIKKKQRLLLPRKLLPLKNETLQVNQRGRVLQSD